MTHNQKLTWLADALPIIIEARLEGTDFVMKDAGGNKYRLVDAALRECGEVYDDFLKTLVRQGFVESLSVAKATLNLAKLEDTTVTLEDGEMAETFIENLQCAILEEGGNPTDDVKKSKDDADEDEEDSDEDEEDSDEKKEEASAATKKKQAAYLAHRNKIIASKTKKEDADEDDDEDEDEVTEAKADPEVLAKIQKVAKTLKVGDMTTFGKVIEIKPNGITFKNKDTPKTFIKLDQRKNGGKDYVLKLLALKENYYGEGVLEGEKGINEMYSPTAQMYGATALKDPNSTFNAAARILRGER